MEALGITGQAVLEQSDTKVTRNPLDQPAPGQDLPNIIKALRTVRSIPIQTSNCFPAEILEMIRAAERAYNAIDEWLAQTLEHIAAGERPIQLTPPKNEPLELNENELNNLLTASSIGQLETIRANLDVTACNLNTGYEYPLRVVATVPAWVETLIATGERTQKVIMHQLVEALRRASEITTEIVVAKKQEAFAREIARIGDTQFGIAAGRGIRFRQLQGRARAAIGAGIEATHSHITGVGYLGSPTYPTEIRTTSLGEIQSGVINAGIARANNALAIPTKDIETFAGLPGGILRGSHVGDRKEDMGIKLGIVGL